MGKRIALVLPYYGRLPVFFNYFLRSLEGRDLDVLFISDLKVSIHPDNFKPIKLTFEACRRLIGVKLGCTARLESPRRLCDFRPMYGKIFEDYLKEYDYWAYGDCDLVFGSRFNADLAEACASECDVFSSDAFFCSGPFCMIKNCERMNCLYLKADNLTKILAYRGRECFAFDELCGEWHFQLRRGEMTIEDCRKHGDSFTAIVQREPGLKLLFKTIMYQNDLADGEVIRMAPDGKLYGGSDEISVYHYVRVKMRRYFKFIPQAYEAVRGYRITQTGFYPDGWRWRFRHLIHFKRLLMAGVAALAFRVAKTRGVA